MEIIVKILNFYLSLEEIINSNIQEFSVLFILISVIWISLIGIVTPVLLVSAIAFGYFGIIISLFILTISSIINFFMAKKSKDIFKKFKYKKPEISNDPFLIFIIFRLVPGIPYLIKNMSVIFFKLNLTKFFLAVVIADTPQIIIFTFFFKRLLDSSSNILINKNYTHIFDQMLFPTLCLISFFILIYIFKRKQRFKFLNKN